jgi:hypothetical protein
MNSQEKYEMEINVLINQFRIFPSMSADRINRIIVKIDALEFKKKMLKKNLFNL